MEGSQSEHFQARLENGEENPGKKETQRSTLIYLLSCPLGFRKEFNEGEGKSLPGCGIEDLSRICPQWIPAPVSLLQTCAEEPHIWTQRKPSEQKVSVCTINVKANILYGYARLVLGLDIHGLSTNKDTGRQAYTGRGIIRMTLTKQHDDLYEKPWKIPRPSASGVDG